MTTLLNVAERAGGALFDLEYYIARRASVMSDTIPLPSSGRWGGGFRTRTSCRA